MKDQIKEQDRKLIKNGIWVFFTGILLMILFPILFTRNSGLLDFSESGQIGDTIGGITAPIIGLIGAVLVFLSFREQWLANQYQMKTITETKEEQLKSERIILVWNLYNEIKNDIKNSQIEEYTKLLINKGSLSLTEGNNLFYLLFPIMDNLKLLLLTFQGMDQGRINKDYSGIFIYKFELIIGLLDPYKIVVENVIICNFFNAKLDELKSLQKELRELNWE